MAKMPPSLLMTRFHTNTITPPDTIPATAAVWVVRFQNREKSITGPKVAPKPAQAKLTMLKITLSSSRAMTIPTRATASSVTRLTRITCLSVAVFIGLVGRTLFPDALLTASSAENVFILLATNLLPPVLAGLVMAGILAATISSSDSYLLIAASAFAKNIYQGLLHRKANDRQVMNMSRFALIAITVIAIVIALDENSVIFTIVSFAWAGFGATFGPLMLFSLFWKRINRAGAIAGMIGGGCMVFLWNLVISKLGGIWDIYELLPAFLFSSLCIVVVSLLTAPPSKEIEEEFDAVRASGR